MRPPKPLEERKWQWYAKIKSVIASINKNDQADTTYALIRFFGSRYQDDHMKNQLNEKLKHKISRL